MSGLLLWIVTGLYVGQAAVCFWSGQKPLGVVFAGYAFANLGLLAAMK
jgi:hypothetical protein